MITPRTIDYIKSIALVTGKEVPTDYLDTLDKYVKMVKKDGYVLKFRERYQANPYILNANAGLFRCSSIVVTPRWVAQLVFNDTAETKNAFLATLGHEMTHKEGDIFPFIPCRRCIRFIAHTNEVHADFGAAKKMFGSSKAALLKTMEYKRKSKIAFGEEDNDDITHPSWEQRMRYVREYQFNEELVKKIADNVECKNKMLIKLATKKYQDIILIDDIQGDTD